MSFSGGGSSVYNDSVMEKVFECIFLHRSLKLDFPRPEEPPPALWWTLECDYSLLVGIMKHGEDILCMSTVCKEREGGRGREPSLTSVSLSST